MTCDTILYETSDRIAWITLNRPERMNALTPQMLAEWQTVLRVAEQDPKVGVVVVTGAGRAFCAGVDLKSLKVGSGDQGAVGLAYDSAAHGLIDTVLNLSKVVIGMVNGACVAGGLELMLTFDLVVASADAQFRDPHAHWGLRPSWGMSQRLPRTVGWLQARELSYTARFFSAQEALQMGMINRVSFPERLRSETIALADAILTNSQECVALIKKLYNQGMATTLAAGLEIERLTPFAIRDTSARLATFQKRP